MEWYGNARRFALVSDPSQRPASGLNAVGKGVEKLLTNTGRRKQLHHIFSALFYDTHVKPLVNYSTYLTSLAPGTEPKTEFAYRNSCTHEAWDNAPPDIHQQVMKYKGLTDMSLEELEGLEIDDKEEEDGKRNASSQPD